MPLNSLTGTHLSMGNPRHVQLVQAGPLMFKLVHYEALMVGKWAIGILLECLLVFLQSRIPHPPLLSFSSMQPITAECDKQTYIQNLVFLDIEFNFKMAGKIYATKIMNADT